MKTEADTETETDSCQRWSWTSRRMHKLSETKERWTRLRQFSRWLDHDSNEQNQSNGKVQSNGKMQRAILNTDRLRSWQQLSAHKCATMTETEQTLVLFRTRLCLYIELFGQESVGELTSSVIFVDLSAFSSRVLHQMVQSTREEEWQNSYMMSTMTRPCMLNIHTFSFSVPQSFVCFQSECSVWTCTCDRPWSLDSWRALREWHKKTIHVILWHKLIIFHHGSVTWCALLAWWFVAPGERRDRGELSWERGQVDRVIAGRRLLVDPVCVVKRRRSIRGTSS